MAKGGRKLQFKLLIEKKSQELLFAEVDKDVVDFLFSLFALPMGSVIKLITKESSIGSLGSLYSSWEQLDDAFLASTKMKAGTVIPAVSSAESPYNFALLLTSASPAAAKEVVYKCNCDVFYHGDDVVFCRKCRKLTSTGLSYIGNKLTVEEFERNGYVKDGSIYVVTDELAVIPLKDALAIIPLVNKTGHKDLNLLEEKTVNLDVETEVISSLLFLFLVMQS
jgi:Protein of unknown function (DUF674)